MAMRSNFQISRISLWNFRNFTRIHGGDAPLAAFNACKCCWNGIPPRRSVVGRFCGSVVGRFQICARSDSRYSHQVLSVSVYTKCRNGRVLNLAKCVYCKNSKEYHGIFPCSVIWYYYLHSSILRGLSHQQQCPRRWNVRTCSLTMLLIRSIPRWSLTNNRAHCFLELVIIYRPYSCYTAAGIVTYNFTSAATPRAELLSCGHTHTTRYF